MRNGSQLGCAAAMLVFIGLLLWTKILAASVRLDEQSMYTAVGFAILALFGGGVVGVAADAVMRWWRKRNDDWTP